MDTMMDEQALIRFISTTETAAVGPVLHSALAKLAPEQRLLQFIQLFSHVADFSNRLDESIAAAWHYFGDNEVWRPSFHSLQAFKVA